MERMDGILKSEYGLGQEAPPKAAARQLAAQAVNLYNTRRAHTALALRMPADVHNLTAETPRKFGLNHVLSLKG